MLDRYEECVKEIMDNISDRRGFHMDNLDDGVLENIKEELVEILQKHLK